jgi:1,4-dihydroxy-2-naphthoate octaprenyltransferase
LVASFVPVIVASALAFKVGLFSVTTAIFCLLCSVGLQIATNFINDASDFERGADTSDRIGPARMAQSGAISAKELYLGAAAALIFSFGIGIYLVQLGGPWFLLLGVVSIIAAIAYTAGPFPLAYVGLGDIFVFIFFGLVAIGGGYFLHTQEISIVAIAVAAAIGLLATSIIAVNNTRDIQTDTKANKRTLSVRLGRKNASIYLGALLIAPYFIILALCLMGELPWLAITSWISLPFAFLLSKSIFTANDATDFNFLLEGSAKHQLLFSVLLALGVACG